MASEVVAVVVHNFTSVTYKRSLKRNILVHRTFMRSDRSLPSSLHLNNIPKSLRCSIQSSPYIAQLSNNPKRTSLKLVQIMTKPIRALYKFRHLRLHSKLYLCSNNIIEPNINQNIVGRFIQPIFHPNYLQLIRGLQTELSQLLINP